MSDTEYVDTVESLKEIAARPSGWQRVIHGLTGEYRGAMTEVIWEEKGATAARQFALCGLGDVVRCDADGREFGIQPRCCSSPVCPRCSRRRGLRMLGKMKEALSRRRHDGLYHMVLTQRVVTGEALKSVAERFNRRVNTWMTKVRKWDCLIGGFGAIHVVWSRKGGWHYHMHLLAEVAAEDDVVRMSELWGTSLVKDEVDGEPPNVAFVRLVADAGEFEDLGSGLESTDFWREPEGEVERVLSYFLRDCVKGVDVPGVSRAGVGMYRELLNYLHGPRLFRLYGSWRKSNANMVDKRVEGAEDADAAEVEKETKFRIEIGSPDEVWANAKAGVEMACRALLWIELHCRNNTALGRRLVRFVRAAA